VQLVQLQESYQAFQNIGADIAALAVAPMSSVDGARTAAKATFPMMADVDHTVAETYGVYNLLGDKLAAPSVFVIDTDGHILWGHIGRSAGDRPSVQTILDKLPIN
jgi:peroxiredoxin